MLKTIEDELSAIDGVCTRSLDLKEPFAEMAARFAHEPGSVVLLSGGDLDCARYHILAIRPWMTLSGRHGQTTLVMGEAIRRVEHSPLDLLETILAGCRLPEAQITGPVSAGLFGYLAYDLKDDLETLPSTTIDDLGLPHLYMVAPSLIVVHDKSEGTSRVHAPVLREQGDTAANAALDDFFSALDAPVPPTGGLSAGVGSFKSNFRRSDYERAVQEIRDYIVSGDVYQVNLSQRFEIDFAGDAYPLFQTLYRMNPAPFFAYVNAGDHQVVSTSPERFLRRSGRRVETRPIKGTRPRGKTPQEDRQMKSALIHSPKDDAELSMIVDLMRNDIGKVCDGGSVVVTQHKRLEAYRNVYHLVSVVEGNLAEDRGAVDLIRAAFPGGSITGCPKIRSMEIIDELESRSRHVYTGSIGYISFHDTMDLSIAIRTATITAGRLVFSVGGGIVYDSEPADEYAETLHKGRTLMTVLGGGADRPVAESDTGSMVWQDGRLIPAQRARVPVSDLGLQYGYGFFETIRVENGVACRLNSHLDRFERAWSELFRTSPPDLTWWDILAGVVDKNGLSGKTAAVKILATRGDDTAAGFNGTLLVTARPYRHRLAGSKTVGLNLVTYPHPRLTPLSDHKTLNYLYYHLAGVWAREHDADEALILNPDKTCSETNTANLLVVSGTRVLRPRSAHVLPGVMQAAASRRLRSLGFDIVDGPVVADTLLNADTVLLTNALMGAVPATRIDERPLKVDERLCESLQASLIQS